MRNEFTAVNTSLMGLSCLFKILEGTFGMQNSLEPYAVFPSDYFMGEIVFTREVWYEKYKSKFGIHGLLQHESIPVPLAIIEASNYGLKHNSVLPPQLSPSVIIPVKLYVLS